MSSLTSDEYTCVWAEHKNQNPPPSPTLSPHNKLKEHKQNHYWDNKVYMYESISRLIFVYCRQNLRLQHKASLSFFNDNFS